MWWRRNFQCQFRSIHTLTGWLRAHYSLYFQAALQEMGNKQGLSSVSSAGSSVPFSCAVWTFLGSPCPGLSQPPSTCPGLPSSQQSSGSAWNVPYSRLSVLKPHFFSPVALTVRKSSFLTPSSAVAGQSYTEQFCRSCSVSFPSVLARVPRGVASASGETPNGICQRTRLTLPGSLEKLP